MKRAGLFGIKIRITVWLLSALQDNWNFELFEKGKMYRSDERLSAAVKWFCSMVLLEHEAKNWISASWDPSNLLTVYHEAMTPLLPRAWQPPGSHNSGHCDRSIVTGLPWFGGSLIFQMSANSSSLRFVWLPVRAAIQKALQINERSGTAARLISCVGGYETRQERADRSRCPSVDFSGVNAHSSSLISDWWIWFAHRHPISYFDKF
jgi:hypothetical protein